MSAEWAWQYWGAMVAIAVLQFTAMVAVAYFRVTRGDSPEDGIDLKLTQRQKSALKLPWRSESSKSYRWWMLWMGVYFTCVGTYRAFFVSKYLTRTAWFDSPLNSMLLIRCLAWIAELSWVGQIALALNRAVIDTTTPENPGWQEYFTRAGPSILWGCIFLAQFFATSGVITRNQLWFAIEETFWVVGFSAALPCTIIVAHRVFQASSTEADRLKPLKPCVVILSAYTTIYSLYGWTFHLFVNQWPDYQKQVDTKFPVIQTGWEGISDAAGCWNQTHEYDDWGLGFLIWHTAYFTVCVWIAIFLMTAPRAASVTPAFVPNTQVQISAI